MFTAAKDALASQAARSYANSLIKAYGEVRELKIDSKEKTVEVLCDLNGEHEPVRGVLLEAESSVASHGLGDVDEKAVRHGVPAVGEQGVDDLLRVVPGGARVPQPERGEPVGVDVLGGPLQLRERRDRATRLLGLLVVDLEQDGLVRLDDEGAASCLGICHSRPSLRRRS